LPTRSLAAANPARSGTVSKSQTMTLGFMPGTLWHVRERYESAGNVHNHAVVTPRGVLALRHPGVEAKAL
jgi:hypothetical protein